MNIGEVPVLYEAERGCGYRGGGGTYLVTDPGIMRPCGKLPLELKVCPTCGHGIKPARGWTWLDAWSLFGPRSCLVADDVTCGTCPLAIQNMEEHQRMGLLWIGEKFYPTPEDWTSESEKMGASRRLPAVPKDFKVGETWVLVAHRKVDVGECPGCEGTGFWCKDCDSPKKPGTHLLAATEPCHVCDGSKRLLVPAIFHAFRPSRVEYVCKGDETPEELDRLVKRGIQPVIVRKKDEQPHIPGTEAQEGEANE